MPALRVIIAFSILLLIGGEKSVSLGANDLSLQSGKDQDWSKVKKLLEEANDLSRKAKLNRAFVPQRRAKFIQAAEEYRKYIEKHLRDDTNVEYVTAVFALGMTWENAGRDFDAKVAYDICDGKEAKNNPRAKHNGMQLAPLLRARLFEMNRRLAAESRITDEESSGGGSSHDK